MNVTKEDKVRICARAFYQDNRDQYEDYHIVRLPTLFKKSSTGKIQQWSIRVSGNKIISEAGYVGMKLRESTDVIKSGKNIGKKNETTPHEQAVAEARSRHQKHLDKGFTFSADKAKAGEVTSNVGGGYFPMLARSYDKASKHIKFPCCVQPKLDGLRAPFDRGFFSRSRKPFAAVNFIADQFKKMGLDTFQFDGELYNHDLRDNFEEIVSAIKRESSDHPLLEKIEYHIYDMPIPHKGFSLRNNQIKILEGKLLKCPSVRIVETRVVKNEEELLKAYEDFMEQGYEGAMVRNFEGEYEMDKRSVHLQKLKVFQDDEFKVIGVEEGRGQLAGCVGSFICEVDDEHGKRTFMAKLKGDGVTKFLRECWEDDTLWNGRWLQVEFQGYTRKNKVPRFPRGVKFRDAE